MKQSKNASRGLLGDVVLSAPDLNDVPLRGPDRFYPRAANMGHPVCQPFSFKLSAHLACWQGDYGRLRRILQDHNVLVSPGVEPWLLHIGVVPTCQKGRQGLCTHKHFDHETKVSCCHPCAEAPCRRAGGSERSSDVPDQEPEMPTQSSLHSAVGTMHHQDVEMREAEDESNSAMADISDSQNDGTSVSVPLSDRRLPGNNLAPISDRQTARLGESLDPVPCARNNGGGGGSPTTTPGSNTPSVSSWFNPRFMSCSLHMGSALQLAIDAGSLSCANLLLVVLLIRKLLALKLLDMGNPILQHVWMVNPMVTMQKVMGSLEAKLRTYVLGFSRLSEHMCTFAVACLLEQSHVVGKWLFPPICSARRQFMDQRVDCLLASAVASGDPHIIRSVVLFHLPGTSGNVFASASCLALKMAGVLNLRKVYDGLQTLAMFNLFQDYNSIFLNFIRGVNGIHRILHDLHDNPIQHVSWGEIELAAQNVCRHAGFLFDSSVLQPFVLQEFDREECSAMALFMCMKTSSNLPQALHTQFQMVFMDLCWRGAAGSFLQSLEEDGSRTLFSLLPEERGSLILRLVQYIRATEQRFPTRNSFCHICRRPLLSFLIWLGRQPSDVLPTFNLREIVCYNRAMNADLALYRRLCDSPFCIQQCEYHIKSFRETHLRVPTFYEDLLEANTVKTLRCIALNGILDNLNVLQGILFSPNMPKAVLKYIFIENTAGT